MVRGRWAAGSALRSCGAAAAGRVRQFEIGQSAGAAGTVAVALWGLARALGRAVPALPRPFCRRVRSRLVDAGAEQYNSHLLRVRAREDPVAVLRRRLHPARRAYDGCGERRSTPVAATYARARAHSREEKVEGIRAFLPRPRSSTAGRCVPARA